jgi:hypothetical protein
VVGTKGGSRGWRGDASSLILPVEVQVVEAVVVVQRLVDNTVQCLNITYLTTYPWFSISHVYTMTLAIGRS